MICPPVDFSEFDRARSILERTHAFADPNEADAAGIHLVIPHQRLSQMQPYLRLRSMRFEDRQFAVLE